MIRHPLLALAVPALLVLALSACGKRPTTVDPPPGVVTDTFPKTYPNPQAGSANDGWTFP